jgi:hypothetical protein
MPPRSISFRGGDTVLLRKCVYAKRVSGVYATASYGVICLWAVLNGLCRGRLTGDEGLIAHLPFSLVQSLATVIRSTSPWNLAFLYSSHLLPPGSFARAATVCVLAYSILFFVISPCCSTLVAASRHAFTACVARVVHSPILARSSTESSNSTRTPPIVHQHPTTRVMEPGKLC